VVSPPHLKGDILMPTITTKAPLPVDTDALKLYRLSSQGSWMPTNQAVALRATPDAGWYLMEWMVTVTADVENNAGVVYIDGGGLKSQDERGNGTYSTSIHGLSINVASNNSIATSFDRAAQGSLVMFLDGTQITIWAREDNLSIQNQFVFTRFALPNGSDLG